MREQWLTMQFTYSFTCVWILWCYLPIGQWTRHNRWYQNKLDTIPVFKNLMFWLRRGPWFNQQLVLEHLPWPSIRPFTRTVDTRLIQALSLQAFWSRNDNGRIHNFTDTYVIMAVTHATKQRSVGCCGIIKCFLFSGLVCGQAVFLQRNGVGQGKVGMEE